MVEVVNKTRRRGLPAKGGLRGMPLDVQRVAKAIGANEKSFVESGTVGVDEDDGTFNVKDPQAIAVDALGALVRVRLEPSGKFVTARYSGLCCGRAGAILVPVRPGDEVVVLVPNGDYNASGVKIISFEANATAQIPTPASGRPWANDRALLFFRVPLEISALAVDIQSPNLMLNGRAVLRGPESI